MLCLLLVVFCWPVAAGAQEQPPTTPEELVKAYVKAMKNGDEKALTELMPEMAAFQQRLKKSSQRLDEKIQLEKEWRKEMVNKFRDKNDDHFAPAKDVPATKKDEPLAKAYPDYSAIVVEKKELSKDHVELTLDVKKSKETLAEKVKMEARKKKDRWEFTLPDLVKLISDSEERTVASNNASLKAMQTVLADLKSDKFKKQEDAETAWKKAQVVTPSRITLQGSGERELPMIGPGPPLPVPQNQTPSTIEFYLADHLAGNGLVAMKLPGKDQTIYVAAKASLTKDDIEKVVAIPGDNATTHIHFKDATKPKLEQIMKQQDARLIAVLVNGKPVATSRIDNKLAERLIITGVDRSYFADYPKK
jgi:hypothetical protein